MSATFFNPLADTPYSRIYLSYALTLHYARLNLLSADDNEDDDEYEHCEEKRKNNCMCKRNKKGRRKRAYGGGCECLKSGVLSQGPLVLGGMPVGWKCACMDKWEVPTAVNVICNA
jgi:hypothetical protein